MAACFIQCLMGPPAQNTFLTFLLPCLNSTLTVATFIASVCVQYIWPEKHQQQWFDLVKPPRTLPHYYITTSDISAQCRRLHSKGAQDRYLPLGNIAICDAYRPTAKETPLGAICLLSYRAMHAGHIIDVLLPKNKRHQSLLADQIVPHSFFKPENVRYQG